MKTTKLIKFIVLIFIFSSFTFIGCKKDKKEDPAPDSSSMQQLTKDENEVDNNSNDALNDINSVLSVGATKSLELLPCNATIDSTTVINDSITYHITYNGLNCYGTRNRVGQVEFKKEVGTYWGQVGASISVKFINLKITRISTGKSLTLNGTNVYTNVSGGLLVNLGVSISSIVHTAVGILQATFDDGSIRTWNVNKKRTFTGSQGQIVLTVDGQASINGYNNLAVWGVNRNSETFYTQISQSVVHKQICNWEPEAGVVIHQIPANNKKVTVTFGFDDNNNPVPVSGDNCATRYRIDWESNGHSGTLFLQL